MKIKNLLSKLSTRNRIIIITAILIVLFLICSICFLCIMLTPTSNKSTSSNSTKEEGKEDIAGVSIKSTNLEIITKDNSNTTDDSILIEGNVDATTSKVLINEIEVGFELRDSRKYFGHWMPIEIGENTFVIKSYAENGEEDKSYTLTTIRNQIPTYKVVSITDGDTIRILYNQKEEKVRLIGIDTPESLDPNTPIQCFSKEATDKMKSLVEGKNIKIEFDKTQGERDKYDRLLLYIWEGDNFINDIMIRTGYAHEYTYNLPYNYQKQFKQAEKEAKENKKGLWGNACACEKEKEQSRSCVSCNLAKITYTNWDCSTYTKDVTDSSCINSCQTITTTTSTLQPQIPKYTCDCKKTCDQITTCEEAQYQLNVCGCKARDNDKDGIACDTSIGGKKPGCQQ